MVAIALSGRFQKYTSGFCALERAAAPNTGLNGSRGYSCSTFSTFVVLAKWRQNFSVTDTAAESDESRGTRTKTTGAGTSYRRVPLAGGPARQTAPNACDPVSRRMEKPGRPPPGGNWFPERWLGRRSGWGYLRPRPGPSRLPALCTGAGKLGQTMATGSRDRADASRLSFVEK